MKEIDWKVLSTLMVNSKLSDRELAKAIGSSQPTVTRTRRRLNEKGYIKEYTVIPDFSKLGFEIMAFTFTRFKKALSEEQLRKIREAAREMERESRYSAIMVLTGHGLGFDRVVVSFHENYGSFVKFLKMTKRLPFLDLMDIDSFVVSLSAEDHYMPCTMSGLARYIIEREQHSEERAKI